MAILYGGLTLYARRVLVPLVAIATMVWFYISLQDEDSTSTGIRRAGGVLANGKDQQLSHSSGGRLGLSEYMAQSEKLYKTFIRRRDAMLEQKGFGTPSFNPWSLPIQWWWYFQPAYNCPHEVQRVGTVADGGKWVCGLSIYEKKLVDNCVIYSFGVSNDSTFEQELLERTDCEIYAFDASVAQMGNGLSDNPRVHFRKVFVGGENKVDKNGVTWKTIRTLMKENSHTWIDLLKIDIEGHEYSTLNTLMDEFADTVLPFSQLQLELHLGEADGTEKSFSEFLAFWRRMESFGLRAFWTELNTLPTILWKTKLWYSEYSFINTAGSHPLIQG